MWWGRVGNWDELKRLSVVDIGFRICGWWACGKQEEGRRLSNTCIGKFGPVVGVRDRVGCGGGGWE